MKNKNNEKRIHKQVTRYGNNIFSRLTRSLFIFFLLTNRI